MAIPLVLTQELDAVNLMLSVIGESPVNSLNISGLADVAIAYQILTEVSLRVQERGWAFNTEYDYPLTANAQGLILLPPNTLRMDQMPTQNFSNLGGNFNVVARGLQVYDLTNHTYIFTPATLAGLTFKARMVFMLDYATQLPQAARYYIAVSAARIFQKRTVSSTTLEKFTQEDEEMALISMQDQDTDVGDYNMLTGNWDVQQIVTRF